MLHLIAFKECQVHVGRLETEVRERSAQVEALSSQLQEIKVEKSQLVEQLASINSLLEASQARKEEDKNQVGHFLCLVSDVVTWLTLHIQCHLSCPPTGKQCRDGPAATQVNVCASYFTLTRFKALHLGHLNCVVVAAAFRRGTVSWAPSTKSWNSCMRSRKLP